MLSKHKKSTYTLEKTDGNGLGLETGKTGQIEKTQQCTKLNNPKLLNQKRLEKSPSNSSAITLKACLFNARSIVNKIDEFKAWLCIHRTDIVFITETWTTPNINDSELNIPGYSFYRQDRTHSTGGGCLIYFKSHWKINMLESNADADNPNEINYIDYIWIQIMDDGNNPTTLGLYYNSPRSSQTERNLMCNKIREMCHHNGRMVLCGDFNFPQIDWDQVQSDTVSQPFLDCTMDSFLVQHVHEPTRDKNILDLVFSNDETPINDVKITCPIGRSDHNTIQFDLELPNSPPNWKNQHPLFRKGKYRLFRRYLKTINWEHELNNRRTNEMWNKFKSIMLNGINQFIPLGRKNQFPKHMWMTIAIEKAIKDKKEKWHKYQKSKSRADHRSYKAALNATTNAIRSSKRKLEAKIAANIKTDPKAFLSTRKES